MATAQGNFQQMTTREEFRALAAEHRVVPVVYKVLADGLSTLNTYRVLAEDRPGTFPVSYTHLTLPTILRSCRSRWSPYH